MNSRLRTLLATSISVVSFNVVAFDEAGHFYTAYALAKTLRPGDAQKNQLLVAFCAQLPDMVADLDAVTVYSRAITSAPLAWARWGIGDSTTSLPIQKMVTVQHLLHALTGGNASAVHEVAQINVNLLRGKLSAASEPDRAATLCALGLSLHFLGDSYAHQVMDDVELPLVRRRMYATGRGHAADMHYPDYVLCSALASPPRILHHCVFAREKRFAGWTEIWTNASKTYDPPNFGDLDLGAREKLTAAVLDLGSSASDWNNWNESEMRKVLADPQVDDFRDFILSQKSDRPCELVLADALTNLPQFRAFVGLKCAAVWQKYWTSINAAFSKAGDDSRAKLDRSFDQIYIQKPLDP